MKSRVTPPHPNSPVPGGHAIPQDDRPACPIPTNLTSLAATTLHNSTDSSDWRLQGKRVAMVVFAFYPNDPRPRRAAEAMTEEGMRVELICLGEKGDPRREVVNGADVLRLRIARRRGSSLRYMLEYLAFIIGSAAILATRSLVRRYDLVYVHNMPDILVLSGLFPKLFGAKIILDLHDPMPELMMTIFGLSPEALAVRLIGWLEKWSMARADAAITVNQACARLFTSRSCPPQKMSVVMNAPDERIFRIQPSSAPTWAAGARRTPFVLMYHGSLVERNGLDLAVDALARVRRSVPDAELRIYGWETPYLERVMESAWNKGLQEATQYLGPKSLEELVLAITACDVGIIPNRRNNFTELNTPTRIFEYLALGKPVIAPRAAGICDYFDDASLLFFELGNAEDLARMIEYVFSHPVEAAEIARRGQEICQEHSWRKERQRLLGLVAGLLDAEATPVESAGGADHPAALQGSQAHRVGRHHV